MTKQNIPQHRTPGELQGKWQKKQVARIGDAATAGFSLEIQTADTTVGHTRLLLGPTYRERSKVPSPGRTTGFVWGLKLVNASASVRDALSAPLVQVMGVPIAETPGYGSPENPIEPYNDRLFRVGDLILQPFLIEQRPGRVEPLRLGAVVGLNLIVARNTRTVW